MKEKLLGICLAVLLGLAIGWSVAEVIPIKSAIASAPIRGTVSHSLQPTRTFSYPPCCEGGGT